MKKFFIVLGILIILAFIAQLMAAPYVKNLIIQKAKDAGIEISIGNCAVSILQGRIVLENVSVPNPQYKDEYFIKAKELGIDFYLIALLLKKELLQAISLVQPELLLHRDETGTLKYPQFKEREGKKPAEKTQPKILVKRLLIKSGHLKLIDHFISRPPTVISFSDINCDIVNSLSIADKKVLTHIDAKGKIEERGRFLVDVKGNFLLKPRSFDGNIKLENVPLPKFTPYYGENLSVIVKSANLTADARAFCDKENLNSPVKVRIDNVDVEPIGDPTQTILFELRTADVIKYLKDEKGTIGPFEFEIKGNLEKPDFRWGPVIQRALKQAIMRSIYEGVQRTIQRLLEKPQEAGKKIGEIGEVIGGEAGEKVKQAGEKLQEQLEKILGK